MNDRPKTSQLNTPEAKAKRRAYYEGLRKKRDEIDQELFDWIAREREIAQGNVPDLTHLSEFSVKDCDPKVD